MRIGILGGSFDPVHNGHLNMARQAKEEYALDEVWLMPAGHSPNKNEKDMKPAHIRLAMVELAVSAEPYLKASDFEIRSKGISYTYRTMEQLTVQYPEDEFFFIMGADSLDYLEYWVHPEILCKNAVILVVNRDHFAEKDLLGKIAKINQLFHADIRIVHCGKYDVSSHEIRERIALGDACRNLLPARVAAYITENHLYQSPVRAL